MSDTERRLAGWTRVEDALPPIGEVVETLIARAATNVGEPEIRNEAKLKRGGTNGRLWFSPDGSMYVYYVPTHWRRT
jgi:hypothetical protein